MAHPLAGKPAPRELLVDVPDLLRRYVSEVPDPSNPAERVVFGTSGHRGSSLRRSFNEAHILAVTQAVCEHRAAAGVTGPLFLGRDTHALSEPAQRSALEVLAGNGVEAVISEGDAPVPTPVISHAILGWNRGRAEGLADGIVITPSHNPPEDGGIKYNPPDGGPADTAVTAAIERRANELLASGNREVRRASGDPRRAPGVRSRDYVGPYVADLGSAVDLEAARGAPIRAGVEPMGGANLHYWDRIAEDYGLDLTVVNRAVDPTFAFVAIDWLFRGRPGWPAAAGVGKTLVSSALIDRVAARLGRRLVEVPVGFKWFVPGLLDGSLGFGGEESAGASMLRRDGTVWTTDKDGIILNLLASEITAATGRSPSAHYAALAARFGAPAYA